jgi:hypothetical protein
MNAKGLSLILFLAALGLGGWGAWEHQSRLSLESKLATLTKERDVLSAAATRIIAGKSKTAVKSDGPEGLGPENAKALADEIKRDEKPAGPKTTKDDNNPMAGMAKMMKDPAMRDMLKAQMRTQVDFQYRDLFDMMGLPADKQDQLSKLLLDRTSAGMELGMSMMGGEKPSPAEMKEKTDAMKAATEASDKALKELLGDEAFAKFDSFEKSQPERTQLATLNGQLRDKGIALSEDAETKLMDAMYQERTNFKYDVDLSDQKNFDPTKLTPDNISKFSNNQSNLREKILVRAGSILSPPQLEVFRKSQEQQAAMEKLGMEMGAKMLNGGDEK